MMRWTHRYWHLGVGLTLDNTGIPGGGIFSSTSSGRPFYGIARRKQLGSCRVSKLASSTANTLLALQHSAARTVRKADLLVVGVGSRSSKQNELALQVRLRLALAQVALRPGYKSGLLFFTSYGRWLDVRTARPPHPGVPGPVPAH